jgi:hypothetical protein
MARQNYFQNSFATGIVARNVQAQKNFDRIRNALADALNAVCLPTGGMIARPGTLYQNQTKINDPNVRLLPFQFNSETSYVLELGNGYIRFYNLTGLITQNGAAVEVPTPYQSQDLGALQVIQSNDVLFFTHQNYPPQRLSRYADNSWFFEPINFTSQPFMPANTTSTTLTASGSTGVVQITGSSPLFLSTDVGRLIQFAGSSTSIATITAFQSPTVVTAQTTGALPLTATTDWELGSWSASSGYPATATFYEDRLHLAGTRVEPQTLWASVVGNYYNFTPGTNASDALTLKLLSRQFNSVSWLLPFKTLMAGTSNALWSIGSSNVRDLALYAETARAIEDVAYGFTSVPPVIMNKSVLGIQAGGQKVRELAYSFELDGFESQDITLLNSPITGPGIKQLAVQRLPFEILWCLRTDGVLIGLTFDKTQNTIAWHRHNLSGFVNSICCVEQGALTQLYLVVTRVFNDESSQTFERLSPYFVDSDLFNAVQLDCALQIDRTGTESITISPLTTSAKQFLVTANNPIFSELRVGDAFYLLSANQDGFNRILDTYQVIGLSSPSQIIIQGESLPELVLKPGTWGWGSHTVGTSGFLEGVSLQVFGDGADLGTHTVKDGQITLKRAPFKITLGLPYEYYGQTLDWEAGSSLGSSEGQMGRITEINIHLLEAGSGYVQVLGAGSKNTYHLRSTKTPYDTAQELFTGIQRIKPASGFTRTRGIKFGSQSPLPWGVLSLECGVQISDT